MRTLILLSSVFIAAQTLPLSSDADARRRGGGTSSSHKKAPRKARSARAYGGYSGGSSGVYFANCAAARAAGAAPVRAGDPGYSARLDRDRDGVGCE